MMERTVLAVEDAVEAKRSRMPPAEGASLQVDGQRFRAERLLFEIAVGEIVIGRFTRLVDEVDWNVNEKMFLG